MSEAPIVEVTRDKISYRASALGGCVKALVAARLQYESVPVNPESKIAKTFAAGHEAEEKAVERLREQGWVIGYRQHTVVLPITEKIKVVGHIDGVGHNTEDSTYDPYVLEVKSQNYEQWALFDERGWDAGFFTKYKWQASVYMLAMRSPMMLVRWNRDTDEMMTHYIETPFYSLDEIRDRVLEVETLARTGSLPRDCEQSYPCPYFYLHEDAGVADYIEDIVVEGLCEAYSVALVKEKAAKEQKEKARVSIMARLPDKGKYETKEFKVSVYEAKNPAKIDIEKLSKDAMELGLDITDYTTQGSSLRLKVTAKET